MNLLIWYMFNNAIRERTIDRESSNGLYRSSRSFHNHNWNKSLGKTWCEACADKIVDPFIFIRSGCSCTCVWVCACAHVYVCILHFLFININIQLCNIEQYQFEHISTILVIINTNSFSISACVLSNLITINTFVIAIKCLL
jgi:hypothetical protein